MSHAEPTRFRGRCKAFFVNAKPSTQRELRPLVGRQFPLSSIVDLPARPSPRDLAAALDGLIPKFCFAEIQNISDPVLATISEMLCYDPKLGIVAILPVNDADLILRCLRQGASEFLIHPIHSEQFDSAVQKLIKNLPQLPLAASAGKIYSVLPVKGACGATTIASALAFQKKRLGAKRVLLADLDPITGVVSFMLKIKSQYSFADVLQRAADMDDDLWRAMVVDRDGVDVLVAPESSVEGIGDWSDASPVLDYARYQYNVVVADAGCAHGAWTLSQAMLSDEVLLVTTNELSSLQSAQRVLYSLESHGVGREKIHLIVNRYDPQVGLNQDQIARALHIDVQHVIPSDYQAVQKSLLEGKPAPSTSRFGQSLAVLAENLAGREKVSRKTVQPSRLLSLFTRT